jgi:hypothetical protein
LRRLLALQPGLARIEARDTRVSSDLVAELARTHPGLEIIHENPPGLGYR